MAVSAVGNHVVSPEKSLMKQPSIADNGGKTYATSLLLALHNSPTGLEHLQKWAAFVQSSTAELPPVWVISLENSRTTALVRDLAPKFQPFIVEANTSWETVIGDFARQVGSVSGRKENVCRIYSSSQLSLY